MSQRIAAPVHWRIIGKSVRGAGHEALALPNQDAIGWNADDGVSAISVLAVSDGHGNRKCFRSDIGSKFAIEVAIEIVSRFGREARDQIPAFTPAVQNELARTISETWNRRVDDDIRQHPFSKQDEATVDAAEPGGFSEVAADPLLAYGATLLVVLLAPAFVLYAQIGDGDILTVAGDGTTQRTFPVTSSLPLNVTNSLCQRDAWQQFRFELVPFSETIPELIVATTDGYPNSFSTDEGFLQVGRDLHAMIVSDGLAAIERQLTAILAEASSAGSRDDVTIGIVKRTRDAYAPTPDDFEFDTSRASTAARVETTSGKPLTRKDAFARSETARRSETPARSETTNRTNATDRSDAHFRADIRSREDASYRDEAPDRDAKSDRKDNRSGEFRSIWSAETNRPVSRRSNRSVRLQRRRWIVMLSIAAAAIAIVAFFGVKQFLSFQPGGPTLPAEIPAVVDDALRQGDLDVQKSEQLSTAATLRGPKSANGGHGISNETPMPQLLTKASGEYDKATKADPVNVTVWRHKRYVLQLLHDWPDAIHAATAVIAVDGFSGKVDELQSDVAQLIYSEKQGAPANYTDDVRLARKLYPGFKEATAITRPADLFSAAESATSDVPPAKTSPLAGPRPDAEP